MDMRESIREQTELAAFYADDGAYQSAARILRDIAAEISAHADRVQPTTGTQLAKRGVAALCEARELFKAAGNLRTLVRVRAALSSAKGAIRINTNRAVKEAQHATR